MVAPSPLLSKIPWNRTWSSSNLVVRYRVSLHATTHQHWKSWPLCENSGNVYLEYIGRQVDSAVGPATWNIRQIRKIRRHADASDKRKQNHHIATLVFSDLRLISLLVVVLGFIKANTNGSNERQINPDSHGNKVLPLVSFHSRKEWKGMDWD